MNLRKLDGLTSNFKSRFDEVLHQTLVGKHNMVVEKVCPHCESKDLIKETCRDHKEQKGMPFRYNVWYCYDCDKTFVNPKEIEREI